MLPLFQLLRVCSKEPTRYSIKESKISGIDNETLVVVMAGHNGGSNAIGGVVTVKSL
jgi:hypothetical protein